MQKETFNKAKELEQRIEHLTSLIAKLKRREFKCEPPIRDSGYHITHFPANEPAFDLNEGEMVTIIKALEDEKYRLESDFTML